MTDCVDENNNFCCDYCLGLLPIATITADEGCLVNGYESAITNYHCPTLPIIFSYELNDGKKVDYWIIYDESGKEFARVDNGEFYYHSEPGYYHAKPVFRDF
jgi:hypothetical protein